MNPDRIEAGKSVPIIITMSNCKVAWNGLTPALDATSVALLSQSGIQITNLRPIIAPTDKAECTAFAFISILRTTPAISYSFKINITDEPVPQDVTFRVLGIQGIPPGPIPPELERPEVDIMWAVVPKKIASDNFGPRVARNFYCIEIVIGNNSGYDLQVSAVGFKSGPVGEYATVMVAAHKSLADRQKLVAQEASERLKAAIEACKGRTDFAGCVTSATSPILDNMRRQSEADVEALRGLNQTSTDASRLIYDNTIPVTSYPMARGSATRGEFWSIRNWTTRLLGMLGPIAIGFTPFLDVKNQKNFSNAVNLFTNPISEGYSNFWPDEFIPQLQRLDDQILREGRMISNNRQERTTVFIPKRILRLDDDKMIDDPIAITIALGQMVLIGNLVRFVNRVNVTSNPDDGEIGAAPVVDRTFQSEFAQESSGTLAVTGSELEGARITSTDANITAAATTSTRTSASTVLTIDKDTPLGNHTLLLTTAKGSVRLEITVVPPLPSGVSQPGITTPAGETDLSPTAARPVAQEFPFNITGGNLQGARLVPVDPNEVLTVTQIDSQSGTLTGKIRVPARTAIGPHTFRIVNSSLNSLTSGPVVQFEVKAPTAVPDVSSDTLTDNDRRVRIGQAPRPVNFTLKGSNLRFARTVTAITTGPVPVVNCNLPDVPGSALHTEVPCTFTIGADLQDLAADTTYDYRISDGSTRSDTFQITVLAPREISVDPITGDQQVDTPIVLTAANFDGVVVSTEDPNWTVTPGTPTATGFTIKIKAKTGGDAAQRRVTVRFRNSDGSTTDDYVIQLVPLPATPTPTPSPE